MKVLFLHGWNSKPGGMKPTYLVNHGHEVINPALSDDEWISMADLSRSEGTGYAAMPEKGGAGCSSHAH